jgi:hypothetical protein
LIGSAFNKVKDAAGVAAKWVGGGIVRFMDNFFKETAIEIPDGRGIRAGLTLAANKLGLYDWLESIGYAGGKKGQIDKFPNLLQLMNPFKYVPLLFKSFFPEKAEAMAEKQAAIKRGDVAKKNIFGVELSDEHQSDEYIKKRDSGQLPASQNADAISESASYDQPVEGGDTTIISNGGGAIPSGGGGGSSLSLVGGSDFYRAAQLNRKKSNLARVWA